MDKITLVCTSLHPNEELLKIMLKSSEGFDNLILHICPSRSMSFKEGNMEVIYTPHLSITEAYNFLIKRVDTEWICCFCDDDFFYPEELKKMIDEVHKGIDADVAHFKFRISGHCPPEDKRAWVFGPRYTLCERQPITPKLLSKHNRLPAGSFFRKSAWEKAGGFQGNKCHDWDLWLRMSKAGCKFKYFNHLVYEMQRRTTGAWLNQNRK